MSERKVEIESRSWLSGPAALLTGGVIAAAMGAYVYSRNRPSEKREVDGAEHADDANEDPVKELQEFNDWFEDDSFEVVENSAADSTEEQKVTARTQSLDDGLTALGMQSNVMYLPNASPGEIRIGEESHVAVENPDVDDVFRIERVSEEEEMRRYFSGMDSGQRMAKGQHSRKTGSSNKK